MLREINEFAGIEKRALAGGAFLVPDVGLLRIDHPHHPAIASRTPVAVDFVRNFTAARITDINRSGRFLVAQQGAHLGGEHLFP